MTIQYIPNSNCIDCKSGTIVNNSVILGRYFKTGNNEEVKITLPASKYRKNHKSFLHATKDLNGLI